MNLPMQINRLTLKFSGELSYLEAPFLKEYYTSSLPHIRMMMILGAMLYAAFGVLDVLLMPQQVVALWIIRFIVIGPVLVGVLAISFLPIFEKYIQPILALVYFLAGAGIIGMIVVAPPPVSYSYYAGLMLVFMWGYTLIRLFFPWASVAGCFPGQ